MPQIIVWIILRAGVLFLQIRDEIFLMMYYQVRSKMQIFENALYNTRIARVSCNNCRYQLKTNKYQTPLRDIRS